jgi:hypothetical protein
MPKVFKSCSPYLRHSVSLCVTLDTTSNCRPFDTIKVVTGRQLTFAEQEGHKCDWVHKLLNLRDTVNISKRENVLK